VVASARQPPDELREPPRIAKGPSVAEEDESRLQMKELAGGPALHGSVMRNMAARAGREYRCGGHVVEHVADDENAVRLAPEADLSG
jgi:hypothetical protein